MAKYQKYAEYQDSGVEWLGEIPKDWGVLKLKYAVDLISEKSQDINQKYVGMENITSKNGKYVHTEEVIPEGISNTFKDNDVLFGKLRPYLAKSWLASFSGICSSELLVLRAKEICPKFLQYYTLTDEFINQVDSSTYGSKMPRASWEFISLLSIPKCSFDLSIKIANFLDHETAQIDTLIAKQEKLIELLKEKRQAVISHAVTKGLNINALMKDSGVEWLGQVPEHWTVSRYKYCTSRVVVGIAEAATHAYSEKGIPIIRATNIKEEGININDTLYLKESFANMNEGKYLYTNDIITVRTGYPGISAVIPETLDKSHCFTNLVSTPKSSHCPHFLNEYLNSRMGKAYFALFGWGSAQKNISVPILQEFPIAYPELAEQKKIVVAVQNEKNKFNLLISNVQNSIKLMQERRTALISAAVTGKIDVQNWQNPTEAKMEFSA
jgi:type I restriction enzyme S subunit